LLLQPALSTKVSRRSVAVSYSLGDSLAAGAARQGCRIHVSYAPGGRARSAGRMSYMRHGTGATRGQWRRRGESGIGRYDAPVLDQPGAVGSAVLAVHVGDAARSTPDARALRTRRGLDSVGAGHAGGAMGRMAIPSARLGFDSQPSFEHVYPHRPGHGDRVWL